MPAEHFRVYVVGRSATLLQDRRIILYVTCKAKVCQAYFEGVICIVHDKNVLKFEISMNHSDLPHVVSGY